MCDAPKKKEFKIDEDSTLRVPEKWDKKRKHDEIILSATHMKAKKSQDSRDFHVAMGCFTYKKGSLGYSKFFTEIKIGFTSNQDSARGNNKNFLFGLVPKKCKNFNMYIGEEENSIGY